MNVDAIRELRDGPTLCPVLENEAKVFVGRSGKARLEPVLARRFGVR